LGNPALSNRLSAASGSLAQPALHPSLNPQILGALAILQEAK
jgi:hypothetical protein